MWITRVTTSTDVCVGDVNNFKTVQWWDERSKMCKCNEVEPFHSLPHEPFAVVSTCTDNKIDVKKYFEEKSFGNERLSMLRNTFGGAMAEKKNEFQKQRAKQIRKKQK